MGGKAVGQLRKKQSRLRETARGGTSRTTPQELFASRPGAEDRAQGTCVACSTRRAAFWWPSSGGSISAASRSFSICGMSSIAQHQLRVDTITPGRPHQTSLALPAAATRRQAFLHTAVCICCILSCRQSKAAGRAWQQATGRVAVQVAPAHRGLVQLVMHHHAPLLHAEGRHVAGLQRARLLCRAVGCAGGQVGGRVGGQHTFAEQPALIPTQPAGRAEAGM